MCQSLKEDAQKCDQDTISISFVSQKCNQNIDQLDPTFMYTQILKEILLTIDFTEEHTKKFTEYYRENFADNTIQLNNIDQFEMNYDQHLPIWWYTHECCLYSLLNRALRMMEVDTIIKMGFFIRALHEQIVELHSEQYNNCYQSKHWIVYRGQSLSQTDFDQLQNTQGGLMSFNNFLSTSKDIKVAQSFARSALANHTLVSIVFVIKIDPAIKSAPYASIRNVSHYDAEDEILFSMHTVFRIGDMIESNENSRLWQVELFQTTDNDAQLNALTERMRTDIRGSTGWDRLGKLLMKLGQFDKAEELYEALLGETSNNRERAQVYHQLGWSNKNQKKYDQAIVFFEKSLEIKQQIYPSNHHALATSFNEIGSVYERKIEYDKAWFYYKKGLNIQLETSPVNGPALAATFSSIGSVLVKMDNYPEALSIHEKAIEIWRKLNLPDDPKLAYSYHNTGFVYEKMGEHTKALASHKRALEIRQKSLPDNHPDLAQSYSNIGFVYNKMGQYFKARPFHQQAVDIGQRSLPNNHHRVQQWKKNLEFVERKCK
ncbi:unnamed protein product [Adineta steineri]|uniref:NAD(P)(+)--arginine ADP-ribosyltransferase n=1 Tax=Adineta steineri TaxID=433720 RepID=A0A819CPP4_9BILA|nr:unnamed protein product [Adineta steineri]CAF3821665.1 unnamed protein product [Adineta steineri]